MVVTRMWMMNKEEDMKKVVLLVLMAVMVGALGVVQAENPDRKYAVEPQGPRVVDGAPYTLVDNPRRVAEAPTRSATIIQYDSGNFNAQADVRTFVFGHRFNSNEGAPIDPAGQITQLQFYMFAMSDNIAWCSFYGPPSGTSAPVITAFPNSGVAVGMNTVSVGPFDIATIGTDFLAGALNFNSAISTTGDGVGLDVGGTNMGQGFHGMMIHSTFTPTGYQTLGTVNPIFRVLGTSLPVELMKFEITD
jgi:hypothetical protein